MDPCFSRRLEMILRHFEIAASLLRTLGNDGSSTKFSFPWLEFRATKLTLNGHDTDILAPVFSWYRSINTRGRAGGGG